IQFRFFTPMKELSEAWLTRLTTVDYVDRMALVGVLNDDLVAVGRYDRLDDPRRAEVAFTVEDAHQGRGIGTLLLEHLALAARERGIDTFAAEVLTGNRRMLDVFHDTAFPIEQHFEGGAIHVEFPITPTEAALVAQSRRERVAEARSMERVLAPRSIAVVGASRRAGTIGHEIFRNLVTGNFSGPVYPVNPTARSVAAVRAYPSVVDVPGDVDLAVVAVPAEHVGDVLADCARRQVRGVVVITAGFAELDGGSERQRELVELARRSGMRLIGPNCMGIVNTSADVRMNATFAPVTPAPGRMAFASQSGGLGIELLHRAGSLGLGISSFVSLGNKADVSSNDLLPYWHEDPDTDVILLYLESFGNPRKFGRLAREVGRTKPIVAVKGGRTATGVRAASSHTAALSSPDATVGALFRQAGVIRVDTLEQLFDTAQVLSHQPLPAGRRLAIVSNGGGPAILAADASDSFGLEVPELSDGLQAELRRLSSPEASVRNPIDLVASATAGHFDQTLRALLASDEVDAVLAIFVPPLVTDTDDVARAIVGAADGTKPVVACFLGQEGMPEALRSGGRAIPSFAFPESAVRALGRVAGHAEWLRRDPGTVPALAGVDADAARALVDRFLARHPEGGWLDAEEALALVGAFGVPCLPSRRVSSATEAVTAGRALG
ncbi:MAG: GNAT family N-acetyltransferase, partial [Acidimicrobiales bacterium]|nr:GNAT family N-acetyltransferase [Acidimicrobiales bacterium]